MRFSSVLIAIVAVTVSAFLAGCGSSDGGKPQSIATNEQVNKIVEMRTIFDKAGGKWEILTAEDKAEFTKLAGDDAKAQSMWKTMSTPMGANPQ